MRIYLSVTSILTEYKETLFKVFLRFIMRVLPLRVATAFLMRNKLKISQTNMFVIYSKQSHFICDLKTENYSGLLSFGFSLAALNILRRVVRLFKIKKRREMDCRRNGLNVMLPRLLLGNRDRARKNEPDRFKIE